MVVPSNGVVGSYPKSVLISFSARAFTSGSAELAASFTVLYIVGLRLIRAFAEVFPVL